MRFTDLKNDFVFRREWLRGCSLAPMLSASTARWTCREDNGDQ
jgi:hypothetical protein